MDIEEGDSGIDANSLGSCSSNEVKVSSTDRQKDKKSKKPQQQTTPPIEDDKQTATTKRESRIAEKFSELKSSKKKKRKEKELANEVKVTCCASKEIGKPPSQSFVKMGKKWTEVIIKPGTSSKTESKVSKSGSEDAGSKGGFQNEEKKKNKKETGASSTGESSHSKNMFVEEDDFEAVTADNKKKKHSHDESTLISMTSLSPSSFTKTTANGNVKGFTNGKQTNLRRGEEEWKEVVRKCLSPTYRVKKVSVPLTAISRVIGRGGCNINAIRSTTGAHIEIEKQSKGQGERIITIKGSIEATKQAHTLIGALIDDPELDITLVLPKSSKSAPSNNTWEKMTTNAKSKTTIVSTTMSSTKTVSTAQLAVSPVISFVPSLTKTSSTPAVSSMSIVSSASYSPALRASLNMTRLGAPKVSATTFSSFDKKSCNNPVIITTTVTASSTASQSSSGTKTTMSYTSAIMMSTGKAPPKSAVPTSSISTTTVVSQTFAAKVSETAAANKESKANEPSIMKPPIAPPPPTSNSIFLRPPPTASAPPTLPATPNKPPFSMQQQTSSSGGLAGIVSQPLATLPAQLSQQLSHPPPPLPTTMVTSSSQPPTKMTEIQISALPAPEEPSPVSTASEYSLFNDTFTKVTQQSMWGRDNDDLASQKGMNFASVVTASGSPNSSVGNANNHSTYLDTEPPVQVDASKAPGYRGSSMCSPNLQKPSSAIRSSVSTNLTSMSPSSSLAFSNSTNTLPDQMTASVTAPISRPTSVPSSMDSGLGGFSPRALFHDKSATTLFPCDQVQPNVSCSSSAADDLSLSLMRLKVVSRLNPRAPDFRVPVKQSTVSLSANQLPPTHQPPPMFNQQSLTTANYLNTQQHPPTMMANSNMMSFPVGKYGQQSSASTADVGQSQWSLMNAAAHHSNYSQNDLINFVTPTTLNSLMHAQGGDMLSGLENGTLTNNGMNISPNSNASLMAAAAAACLRNEERKAPPKPIGTERAWRTERERTMPLEQDPGNWMLDQKQSSWNQQIFRNSNSSAVTAVQTASAAATNAAAYSCLQQVPDDVRAPILENVYQNDHFNGIVQNTVLPTALPSILPHMNIGQVGGGAILQSFNPDVTAYPDTFKMESGWDPSRLCVSDIALPTEKSHHQQQPAQPPNWTLSWNH